MDILFLELRKLGLKEKEVRVYLVGLELGPSSAQTIAKKANISRPTCYSIIQSLTKKKLFFDIAENRKHLFAAQPPEKILHLLHLQKREIEEREREFLRIIAMLETISSPEKSMVFEYAKVEGRDLLYEKISHTQGSEIVALVIADEQERKRVYQKIKERKGVVVVQEILCSAGLKPLPLSFVETRILSADLPCTLILTKSAVLFLKDKSHAYILEHPTFSSLLKSLFDALWLYAKPFSKRST